MQKKSKFLKISFVFNIIPSVGRLECQRASPTDGIMLKYYEFEEFTFLPEAALLSPVSHYPRSHPYNMFFRYIGR